MLTGSLIKRGSVNGVMVGPVDEDILPAKPTSVGAGVILRAAGVHRHLLAAVLLLTCGRATSAYGAPSPLPTLAGVVAFLLITAPRAACTPTTAPTPNHALDLEHSLCFDQCALDDQVGGMDATLMNGATCTPGEGVVFDGVNDYVDLLDVPLGGPMTIASWARWDALNSWSRLCDFGEGTSDVILIGNKQTRATIAFHIRVGSSNRCKPNHAARCASITREAEASDLIVNQCRSDARTCTGGRRGEAPQATARYVGDESDRLEKCDSGIA